MIMTEEQEFEWIKESKKWTRKVYLTIFGIVVGIIAICGILFGKIVEATLFEEIAKWALMAIVLGILVCGILYVPVSMLSQARRKFYPEYGKKWFKHALKSLFGKK